MKMWKSHGVKNSDQKMGQTEGAGRYLSIFLLINWKFFVHFLQNSEMKVGTGSGSLWHVTFSTRIPTEKYKKLESCLNPLPPLMENSIFMLPKQINNTLNAMLMYFSF